MTAYISSLIEPVFRHARRLSRSAFDPERLAIESEGQATIVHQDAADEQTTLNTASAAATAVLAPASLIQNEQDRAPDRSLAGDTPSEEANVLSTMSTSPPPGEADLRRLDQERIRRTQRGAFGSSYGGFGTESDAASSRLRGRTDPLPRRLFQRDVGPRRHISWQSQDAHEVSSISASQISASPSSVGGFGFIDDPITSRSVPMGGSSQQSPMSIDPSSPGSPVYEGHGPALPEDDGMRAMRDRIQVIQASGASVQDKSRLMHAIMTERWMAGQQGSHRDLLKDNSNGRPDSPAAASLKSQEAPTTPRSGISTMDGLQGPGADLIASPSTSLFTESTVEDLMVTPDDLQPTYWVSLPPDAASSVENATVHCIDGDQMNHGDDDITEEQDEEVGLAYGCAHYKRNVKLQCADCRRWYTCRFCHDAVESHTLVRRRTRNMLCMYCGTAQPAAKTCHKCLRETASYYCSICKLWDDDMRKRIYHCDACGICRIGEGLGKDFYHCPTCDVCISMSIKDTHRCIERSVDCDCPICGEYMFDSPTTVIFMRCGHGIHHACYKMYLQRNYRCPICAKSVLNMDITFRSLDRAIAAQPMPEEFRATKAIIQCNDCRCKSSVPYHWLGLKCVECDSYNTAQLSIISSNESGNLVISDTVQSATAMVSNSPQLGSTALPPTLRGRTESASQPVENRSRRPTSTGGMQDLRPSVSSDNLHLTTTSNRSASAVGMNRLRTGWDEDVHIALPTVATTNNDDNTNDDDDGDDDDDDADDLDFWGGNVSPSLRPHPGMTDVMEQAESGASDTSDSSNDDDLAAIWRNEDDDEDDIDEDDITLFGHR